MLRANIYQCKGEYEIAINKYLELIDKLSKNPDDPMYGEIYNNIILLLNNTKKYDLALGYCRKEYLFAQKLKSEIEMGWACLNFFENPQIPL